MRKCSVLFVAAEAAPFASIGGLSQVLYFLPRALKKQGHDISVFMPKYGSIDEKKFKIKPFITGLSVPTGENKGIKNLICNIKIRKGNRYEPTVYFLENMEYYEQRANVYGYIDDHIRFGLLSRAVLEFLRKTKNAPDIIHTNDWHAGYVADFLRSHYKSDRALKKIATVFTIHNLQNQGTYDFRSASPLNFDDGRSKPFSFFDKRFRTQNPIKRAIIYSDIVNTVSETYAREIMTEEYGERLQDLLREVRSKVFGVLNGIDYNDFDPANDSVIYKNFSSTKLSLRAKNKADLQKEFNLTVSKDTPLIAMVGRLDAQKGFDLVKKVLPSFLHEYGIQFVILGSGDYQYRRFFKQLESEYPDQVGTHLMSDWKLPRRIFASCDIFLLPSKFEPGGIVAIEAMRYGAVPVVRATGGLADMVNDLSYEMDPETKKEVAVGTGFTFSEFSEYALYGALIRALEIYKNKSLWSGLVRRSMRADFSWEQSAKSYEVLYRRAINYHKEKHQSGIIGIRKRML